VFTHKTPLAQKKVPFTDLSGEMSTVQLALEYLDTHQFDIVLSFLSNDYIILPSIDKFNCPVIISARNVLDTRDYRIYSKNRKLYKLFGLSSAHTKQIKNISFDGFVYNGLNTNKYTYSKVGGNYMAFLGNFMPSKGIMTAISISESLQLPLEIGAKRSVSDFYNFKVKHLIHGIIRDRGELGDSQKIKLLQNARILLFPISRPEPFGSVMIESMACGTPVIAYDEGSVSEIIKDGETGYIIPPGDEKAFLLAVKKIYNMTTAQYNKMRSACRRRVEEYFSISTMIDGYEKIIRSSVDPDSKN